MSELIGTRCSIHAEMGPIPIDGAPVRSIDQILPISCEGPLNLDRYLANRLTARLAFLLMTLMIVVLALFPNLQLPDYLHLGQHADFFYHAIGFFVLTAAAAVAMDKFALTVAAIAALAIGLEMLQALVPGREVFLSDLVASLAGVALSALCAPIAMQVWRRCARAAWLHSRP